MRQTRFSADRALLVSRPSGCPPAGAVSKFLRRRLIPGIPHAAARGLSGLVDAQLGLPLDKSLQCSTWEKRPLSRQQVEYAAADAAVLLALVDSYAQHAPPRRHSMRRYLQDKVERAAQQRTTPQNGGPGGALGADAAAEQLAGLRLGGQAEDGQGSDAAGSSTTPTGVEQASPPQGEGRGTPESDDGAYPAGAAGPAPAGDAAALPEQQQPKEEEEEEGEDGAAAEQQQQQQEEEEDDPGPEYWALSPASRLAADVASAWTYRLEIEGGRWIKVPGVERPQRVSAEPLDCGRGGVGHRPRP